ncbi:hypothetical protein [Haloplanus halophilus]|uniref:hypothetical protein n=1 Tax=Haloplanus halophilus TaxID=2949993 RepID=UPI0020408100|nr:hypothetical protein [Haloplanus sp. GDY1]
MTDFSTRTMLEVEVDSGSLNDARDTIESEFGSVRATIGSGTGASTTNDVAPLSDGRGGVRDLLEQQTEHLEEIREAIEDGALRGGGGGGGGGFAAATGGAASAAATATGIGLAGLAPIAAFIAAISANAERGPLTDPGAPPARPDTGESARDTGEMDAEPLVRPPDLSNLSWPSIPAPSWLSRLASLRFETPSWLSELTTLQFETPSWVTDLTTLRFDTPRWLSTLTNPRIQEPDWLSTLTNVRSETPSWIQDLQRLIAGDRNAPPAAPAATDRGLAPPDQRLLNEATRARNRGQSRRPLTVDARVEATINGLSSMRRDFKRVAKDAAREGFREAWTS